jgi:hypothetical protein
VSQSEKNTGENMKLLKWLGTVLCLAVLCGLVAPTAAADEWNRETVVTFSGPVEVPGAGAQTLPAGTYVFKIVDAESDRHIVRIFNEDKTHIFTTIIAIPNYRLLATDKTVITFSERPAGQPEALRAWFYPGRKWGEEFVYAKSRAVVLAKEVQQPVLATPIELAETVPVEELKAAPIVAIDPKGEPVELAQVVEPPPVAALEPLPSSASPLPLIALIGLLSLGVGFAVSVASKRVA